MIWIAPRTHNCLHQVALGESSPAAIAAALGERPGYVRGALDRLAEQQGFVRRIRRGQYVLTPAGITYLATTMEDI